MTEFDTKYTYLGTIKLSGYELPKKIIELGDNLIVSLGEKKKKKKNKENLIKIKSILKIFKCNEQQDKNDEIMNDSDSINSMNSCSSWDSIFSNEEENEEDEDENKFQFYDERIKMELYYIDHCGILLDIKIIFDTIYAVIKKDGAK